MMRTPVPGDLTLRDVVAALRLRIKNPCYRRSYALNLLDKKLEPYLNFKSGFFVEAGANNGILQTNTLFFERYKKWRGLLIEPIPSLAEKCRLNRPRCIVENCALVGADYSNATVQMHYCGLMSTVVGSMSEPQQEQAHLDLGRPYLAPNEETYVVDVPARTLSDVLVRHDISHIDLLSLDVEGYEVEVLKGLDMERHRPKYMLIEARSPANIERVIDAYYRPIAALTITDGYQDILYASRESLTGD